MQRIFAILFVIFSLSPCSVKTSVLKVAGMEYAKPINTSKVTSSNISCKLSPYNLSLTEIKKSEFAQHKTPNSAIDLPFTVPLNTFSFEYEQTIFANAPPKYILYNRLKLDVA